MEAEQRQAAVHSYCSYYAFSYSHVHNPDSASNKIASNKVVAWWLLKYFAQFNFVFVTRVKSEIEKATILCGKSLFIAPS